MDVLSLMESACISHETNTHFIFTNHVSGNSRSHFRLAMATHRARLEEQKKKLKARKERLDDKLEQVDAELREMDASADLNRRKEFLVKTLAYEFWDVDVEPTRFVVDCLASCQFDPYTLDTVADMLRPIFDGTIHNCDSPCGTIMVYDPVALTGNRLIDSFCMQKHVEGNDFAGVIVAISKDGKANLSFYSDLEE